MERDLVETTIPGKERSFIPGGYSVEGQFLMVEGELAGNFYVHASGDDLDDVLVKIRDLIEVSNQKPRVIPQAVGATG